MKTRYVANKPEFKEFWDDISKNHCPQCAWRNDSKYGWCIVSPRNQENSHCKWKQGEIELESVLQNHVRHNLNKEKYGGNPHGDLNIFNGLIHISVAEAILRAEVPWYNELREKGVLPEYAFLTALFCPLANPRHTKKPRFYAVSIGNAKLDLQKAIDEKDDSIMLGVHQGHSNPHDCLDDRLECRMNKMVMYPEIFKIVAHKTSIKNWDSIKRHGLKSQWKNPHSLKGKEKKDTNRKNVHNAVFVFILENMPNIF